MGKETFLYFAYGSNLLTERIQINNPSAKFKSIGFLKKHKLDFNNKSKKWGGAVATITPHKEEDVWGVLWELDLEHMSTLDRQEGVPKVYNRIHIEVEQKDGVIVPAVTYLMVKPLVEDRRPSQLYHGVILEGAREHGLPQSYLDTLTKIEHNGEGVGDGSINIVLGRF